MPFRMSALARAVCWQSTAAAVGDQHLAARVPPVGCGPFPGSDVAEHDELAGGGVEEVRQHAANHQELAAIRKAHGPQPFS